MSAVSGRGLDDPRPARGQFCQVDGGGRGEATPSTIDGNRTGPAIAKSVKQLRPLRSATIVINGAAQTFPPEIPDAQREILTHLGYNPGY